VGGEKGVPAPNKGGEKRENLERGGLKEGGYVIHYAWHRFGYA